MGKGRVFFHREQTFPYTTHRDLIFSPQSLLKNWFPELLPASYLYHFTPSMRAPHIVKVVFEDNLWSACPQLVIHTTTLRFFLMLSLCPESWSKAVMVIGISPTVRGTTEKKAGVAEFPLASRDSCTALALVSAVHSPFTASIFTVTCGDKAMPKITPSTSQGKHLWCPFQCKLFCDPMVC